MKLKTSMTTSYSIRHAAKVWSLFVHLLHERTILVLTIMFCSGVAATLWYLSHLSSTLVESGALQSTSIYSQSITDLRTFYSSEVVERVRPSGIEVTHDYATKQGAIPIPVTFTIEFGKHISEKNSGMQIRLYSDYPFSFRKEGGPRDVFEKEALAQLRRQPDKPFFRFEDFQGRPSLRYATAVQMKAGCVTCHNSHPESPKIDWKVGDVRGVQEIIQTLDSAAAQTRAGLKDTFVLLSTMGILGLGGLALVIGRMRRTSVELEQRVAERAAAEAHLSILHETNLAATSTLDLRGALKVLMERIDVLLPYTVVLVWLRDRDTGLWERTACWNLDEAEWKRRELRDPPPIVKAVIENKSSVSIIDVPADPRTRDPEFYRSHGLVSYLGVPLLVKGEVLGVLAFLTKEQHQFSVVEIDFLTTLAGQAAVAIDNSQLHEQTKRQAVELERANQDLKRKEAIQALLKELSQDIASQDIDGLVKKLTDKVREFFKVDVADVRIIENGTPRILGISGIDEARLRRGSVGSRRGAAQWVEKNRRPLVIADIAKITEPPIGDNTRRLGIRGYLAVPFFSRRGEVVGVLRALSFQPRDFLQEEIDLLQQMANGAAIALENARLLEQTQSQAAALTQANKVKNEFLGFVSHELRTPVNVIMGYAALIQGKMVGEVTEDQEKYLEKMSSSSRDLLGMIEQLLEASKIEAGAVQAEIHEVGLRAFLEDLKLGYPLPLNKDIDLVWDGPCDSPVVMTDGEKLRHILQNLISNAIKYTEKGRIVVSSRHLAEVGRLEFRVADTGIGIPTDELPHIFEMFSQVRAARPKSRGGVGLGLHIVKKFTELLGGTIEVASEQGKGSTFTLTIPCTLEVPKTTNDNGASNQEAIESRS